MKFLAFVACAALFAGAPSDEDEEIEEGPSELTLAISHRGADKALRVSIVRNLTRALEDTGTSLILPKELAREEKRVSRERTRRQRLSTAAKRLGANYVLDLETTDEDDGGYVIRAALYDTSSGTVRTSWIIESDPSEEVGARKLGERLAQATIRSLERINSDTEARTIDINEEIAVVTRTKGAPPAEKKKKKQKPILVAKDEEETDENKSAPLFPKDDDAFGSNDEFSAFAANFGPVLEPAQIVEPSASSGGPLLSAGPFEIDAGARLSLENFSYFDNDALRVGVGRKTRRTSLDLAAHGEAKSEHVTFFTRLLLRRDFTEKPRNRLEPEQLWMRVDFWPVEFLAGRTYATWGRASLANPADILNPTDFRDFIATEKRPEWMARAAFTTGALRFEGYYLPFFTPDIVSSPSSVDETGRLVSNSRWVNGSLPTQHPLGDPIEYTFLDAQKTQLSLKYGSIAARVSGNFGPVDAAIGYVYGYDNFPTNTSDSVRDGTRSVFETTISGTHLRRHALTLDGEYAVGNLRFVSEAVLQIPVAKYDEKFVGTFTYLTAVGGLDYLINDVIPNHQLQLFFEVTGTHLLNGEFPNNQNDPEYSFARARFPFPLAVMTRAAWGYANYGTLSITGMANIGQFFADNRRNLDGGVNEPGLDLYVRPELKVQLFQHLDLKLGLDLLLGERDEFFGAFGYNSRFTAMIAGTL